LGGKVAQWSESFMSQIRSGGKVTQKVRVVQGSERFRGQRGSGVREVEESNSFGSQSRSGFKSEIWVKDFQGSLLQHRNLRLKVVQLSDLKKGQ
jgi:hypothetical protein